MWVNVYFGGDMPAVITGEIRNLEEDMIEIKTYPDDDVIYLNFGYKGIPLDLPIETIEIRERPEIVKEERKEEQIEEERSDVQEESDVKGAIIEKGEIIDESNFDIPIQDVKDQVREFILKANEITFGEDLGPIVQYEDVDPSQKITDCP